MTDMSTATLDRRFSPAGNANYELKKLWALHNEIARQMLVGVRPFVIARNLEITTQTVSNVTNSPIFKKQFNGMKIDRDANSVDLSKRIKDVAERAIDLLDKAVVDDLKSEGEVTQVGIRAAISVVDHALPKRIEGRHIVGHLTTEDITRIKRDAINAGAIIPDSNVEEGEFEDVIQNVEHSRAREDFNTGEDSRASEADDISGKDVSQNPKDSRASGNDNNKETD